MSIKLPATMVFYGESDNRPHFLLWWIPPDSYSSLELESGALEALQEEFPNGFEIEVQEEALQEVGLNLASWGVTAAELRAAFLKVHKEGNLPPSGMVLAENLVQLASRMDTAEELSIHELLSRPNQPLSFSTSAEAAVEAEIAFDENPGMTSGEDAEAFFRRLSGS